MYIGLGNSTTPQVGGTGTIYIDDIRLYPYSRQPVDPGNEALVAYYAFENNIQDGSGNGHDGTVFGNSFYVQGQPDYGMALTFDGVEDYVELPIGSVISTLTDSTFALWLNFSNTGGSWQHAFDFGNDTVVYMFLSPRIGDTGVMRFAITTSSNTAGAESQLNAPSTLASGWHHVAVVIDGTNSNMQLYLDGTVIASGPTETLPSDLGETTQNWLGRSQWSADGYYSGSLDDFRIYNRNLSELEILFLAGSK
jgi:hypothetical protein